MSSEGAIDKGRLLDALRDRVETDLALLEKRQRDTQAGSTHEESRAEHAKDTRATEQSYLARGLAERVEELRRTRTALAALRVRDFEPDEPIGLSALVLLETQDEGDVESVADASTQMWWIVSGAGCLDLEQHGRQVRTVTPTAPLGQALLGLQEGDVGTLRTPSGPRRFAILEVH